MPALASEDMSISATDAMIESEKTPNANGQPHIISDDIMRFANDKFDKTLSGLSY
jgi:hypothetical protein